MNKLQKDILVGCLLGDANLHTNTGQTWRLRIVHSCKQQEYLKHLYDAFSSYCKTGIIQQVFFDKRTQKNYFRVYFNSVYTDEFRFYGQSFYSVGLPRRGVDSQLSKSEDQLRCEIKSKLENNLSSFSTEGCSRLRLPQRGCKYVYKKKVPKNIHKFLTARALAYWYMDDGSISEAEWKNKVNSFIFCTESFSKKDNLILKSALERNFNLKVTLQRKGAKKEAFRLYISAESGLVFKNLISPYIHSSMLYKLNPRSCKEVKNFININAMSNNHSVE